MLTDQPSPSDDLQPRRSSVKDIPHIFRIRGVDVVTSHISVRARPERVRRQVRTRTLLLWDSCIIIHS